MLKFVGVRDVMCLVCTYLVIYNLSDADWVSVDNINYADFYYICNGSFQNRNMWEDAVTKINVAAANFNSVAR
jgi:hypothetical protein